MLIDRASARRPRRLCGDEGSVASGELFSEALSESGLSLTKGDELPGGAVLQESGNERGMHGVSGALGDNVAEDVMAGESEVSDEVEDLVADELIFEAQRAVQDSFAVEDDCA